MMIFARFPSSKTSASNVRRHCETSASARETFSYRIYVKRLSMLLLLAYLSQWRTLGEERRYVYGMTMACLRVYQCHVNVYTFTFPLKSRKDWFA